MNTNRAAIEQPLPTEGKESVHEELARRWTGHRDYEVILNDILARAERAQEKYHLDRPGLFTFNGRSAWMDLYQELLDSLVYLAQVEMESNARGERYPLPIDIEIQLMRLTKLVRNRLVANGELHK